MAIDKNGARLAALSAAAKNKRYSPLEDWACALGCVVAFGIEGTDSYGAAYHGICWHTAILSLKSRDRTASCVISTVKVTASMPKGCPVGSKRTSDHHTKVTKRHSRDYQAPQNRPRYRREMPFAGDGDIEDTHYQCPAALRDALDKINGKFALIHHVAALRPGAMTSILASAKAAMNALARRWLMLHDEIRGHDKELEKLIAAKALALITSHGIATMTTVEMLILVGDDLTRIRSEAALAKLCGVCPISASSGKTNCFRLNRGGNRQANAALYRVAIVRMRNHPPTLAYVSNRTKEGKFKKEIIRCLRR